MQDERGVNGQWYRLNQRRVRRLMTCRECQRSPRNRHWKQAPDGGLNRWVSYHEHLPESSYGNWMEHKIRT